MSKEQAISDANKEFEKALHHLADEYGRLQVGRANASLVENILVDVYGSSQPVKAIAGISVPEPRTIQIQPWDRGSLAAIEKAIVGVGTGLNPINDGLCIRVNIPLLTEERRTDLTKHVKKLAEEARISVRTARQDAHNKFKELKSGGEMTEDELFGAGKDLQVKVDAVNKKIDELAATKETDVMTV